jgi:guanine nucleotide-binding protein subunit alpha
LSSLRFIWAQDFDGEPQDPNSGREYFKKRFARLAQKAGRSKEREIYIQSVASFLLVSVSIETLASITTATDTALLRVVMAAVEGKTSCFSPFHRRID